MQKECACTLYVGDDIVCVRVCVVHSLFAVAPSRSSEDTPSELWTQVPEERGDDAGRV